MRLYLNKHCPIWHKGNLRRKTGNTVLLFLLSSRDPRPINDFLLGRSFMIPLFSARGANTSRQRNSRSYNTQKWAKKKEKKLCAHDVHDDACLYNKEVYDYEDMNVRRGREKAILLDWDTRALAIIHDPFLMQ